ncbi:hypothetical protein HNR00_003267 [Methylorubrum rhodinum]|uniref:Uncharacterized protein n=1 Tax=Methylorubrum rhodinum TaxID=29428 RepID=A0A840ZNB6_9HYPH|nr:hypothetical protein [Methylorubrum rhodinum]MBB5758545.1 hypothetical protein [Methylorubrum rhodinum]
MSFNKLCADHLRAQHLARSGEKLGSGHAHEIVAAFFGYGSAAALSQEVKYPLTDLEQAAFLVPDLKGMDQRLSALRGLPPSLPSVDDIATELSAFLVANGHFTGQVWQARQLDDDINGYVQKEASQIEDALGGEMAGTNAYFDEINLDEYGYQSTPDAWIVTVMGTFDGENDPDSTYVGDRIDFSTTMTFDRVAGRTAFADPELDTGGAVDRSGYYDPE